VFKGPSPGPLVWFGFFLYFCYLGCVSEHFYEANANVYSDYYYNRATAMGHIKVMMEVNGFTKEEVLILKTYEQDRIIMIFVTDIDKVLFKELVVCFVSTAVLLFCLGVF
jgi:hypothetical protein